MRGGQWTSYSREDLPFIIAKIYGERFVNACCLTIGNAAWKGRQKDIGSSGLSRTMIVRQFLQWMRTAGAAERANATAALARAYLSPSSVRMIARQRKAR